MIVHHPLSDELVGIVAILFVMQDKNRLEVATEMAYIQTAMTYIKVVSMVDEPGKRVSCRKDIIGFLQYKGLDQDVVAYFANAPDREKAIDHVRSKIPDWCNQDDYDDDL